MNRWRLTSLKNQIFTVIAALSGAASLAIIIIAWAATELAADSFINQRLTELVNTYERKSQVPPASWTPTISAVRESNHNASELSPSLADNQANVSPSMGVHAKSWVSAINDSLDLPHYLNRYDQYSDNMPNYLAGLQQGITELETLDVHVLLKPATSSFPPQYWVYQPNLDPTIGAYGESVRLYVALMAALVFVLGVLTANFLAKKLIRPVIELQQLVNKASLDSPPKHLGRQDELGDLNQSYIDNFQRLAKFIQREKQFTRYASHELRTPVNVIRGTTELLSTLHSDSKTQQWLARLERAHFDMDNLISTFLLLGGEQEIQQKQHCIQSTLTDLLNDLNHLIKNREIELDVTLSNPPHLPAIYSQVLLHNLLRNSLSYSRKHISISIAANRLLITNDRSHSTEQGFGHGQEIITAICQQAGWHFHTKANQTHFYSLIYFN